MHRKDNWKEITEEVLVKVTYQQRNYSEGKACVEEQFTGHFSCIGFSPAQTGSNDVLEPIINKY